MIKVLALNGSARKAGNTASLIKAACKGAEEAGAEVKLVHLYDLDFHGCRGCEACKLLDSPGFASCAVRDGLSDILEEAKAADVVLLGSPMYFGDVSGVMRMFIERFLYPTLTYTKDRRRGYTKRVRVGLFYTSNAPATTYPEWYERQRKMFKQLIGPAEYMDASETLQFDDYSKYAADMFDEAQRIKRHEKVFPEDCRRAFEMGKRLATF